MDLSRTALLIPAYNPDERLCGLLHELAEYGFAALVVVDDGSCAAAKPVFDFIGREIPSAVLLSHAGEVVDVQRNAVFGDGRAEDGNGRRGVIRGLQRGGGVGEDGHTLYTFSASNRSLHRSS